MVVVLEELVIVFQKALRDPQLYKIGPVLQDITREAGLTEEDFAIMAEAYKRTAIQIEE